jgi:hypothetical protein
MTIKLHNPTILAEAALAASVSPCRYDLDDRRWFGSKLALAWRCAR